MSTIQPDTPSETPPVRTGNGSLDGTQKNFFQFESIDSFVTSKSALTVNKTWRDILIHVPTTGVLCVIVVWINVTLARDYFCTNSREIISAVKEKKWIKIITIVCCSICSAFCLAKIFEEVVVEMYAHELCAFSKYFIVLTADITLGLTYAALWIRQRALYNEPTMRHLTSPFLRALGWISGIMVFVYPIADFAMYASTYTLAVAPSGCAIVGAEINPKIMWIMKAVVAVFIHSALLWPFIYPLMKYSEEREIDGINLRPVIVRSLAAEAMCALSDTLVYSVCALSAINDGVTIGVVAQFNVVINLLMIVVVHPDWKKIVFPFCARKENNKKLRPRVFTMETQISSIDEFSKV